MGGLELCGSSSCPRGLRNLLNTEGILTLPMFLLSDGSLIQMWSASFAQWCRVLLSLSIIVKSWSSAFGSFVEMWWFLMALVVWFSWSDLLYLVFQHKRQLTLHTLLISIYNRSVIPMFTPFKLQDNSTFRSPLSKKHMGKQFYTSQSVIFSRKY